MRWRWQKSIKTLRQFSRFGILIRKCKCRLLPYPGTHLKSVCSSRSPFFKAHLRDWKDASRKEAIKITWSWKVLGQPGACSRKEYGGHQGTWENYSHSYFCGTLSWFLLWGFYFFIGGAKATSKTKIQESQLQACSVANYYKLPLSSISERKAISALVKQIILVYNRIRDATDWVAWLYFCDRMSILQK